MSLEDVTFWVSGMMKLYRNGKISSEQCGKNILYGIIAIGAGAGGKYLGAYVGSFFGPIGMVASRWLVSAGLSVLGLFCQEIVEYAYQIASDNLEIIVTRSLNQRRS